jgi:putative ABC transport system permease protein
MLKNYFKIAIAVFKRRKFFTFISLFGISFTLAILMILTALKDSLLSADYPETRRDRSLYVVNLADVSTKFGNTRNSSPSIYFLNKYVATLKTPEKVSIASLGFSNASAYVNNKKLDFAIKYTNADFWDVMEFNFLEGKPYTRQQVEAAENVAVISADVKKKYFGGEGTVAGKYLEVGNKRYRVIGVVKDVPMVTMIYSYSDIYVPYTTSDALDKSKTYYGTYTAVLLARNKSDMPKIDEEYQQVIRRIPLEIPKDFDKLSSHADSYLESFTRMSFGNDRNSGSGYLYLVIGIFVFLFMLLPTVNLVNINVSRIMERSSEIGVRKAFGASNGSLVLQFIFENVLLTLAGGIIGVLIAWGVLTFVNHNELIPNASLAISLKVLFYGFLLCLLFGLFSGVLPAWRMARLQVVNALKSAS